MKKLEITIADALYHQLEAASKRAVKSIEQFVQELLTKASGEMDPDLAASEALLAEGYRMMAKENTDTIDGAMAAQLMAIEPIEKMGDNGNGSDPAR